MKSNVLKSLPLVLLVAASAASAEVHGIVLRVNDRIATLHDFRERYSDRVEAITAGDLEAPRRAELLGAAGRETFCELFQELLVLSRADQLSLSVDDRMIDGAVARAQRSYGFETEAEFFRALESSGRSVKSFREQMRTNLMVQQVMSSQLADRMALEEEDLRRYYQTHLEDFRVPRRAKLREVVVLEASGAPEGERRGIAASIVAAVGDGTPVEEALRDYPDRGLSTGVIDLGWVEAGDLEKELEAAVWDLEAGSVSPPVEGRGGLHVVVVDEVEETRVREFFEVKERIEAIEGQRLFEQESGAFLEELVSDSFIVDRPPPEAAGYRADCLANDPATPDLDVASHSPSP